ncbi:MAG: TonB-dependent receptor, partial [Gemmatimonadales bacterium]
MAALGLLFLPSPALSQLPPSPPPSGAEAAICGVVRMAGSGTPVQGVAVRVEGQNRWIFSGAEGRFCLRGLEPGVLRLVPERIGIVGATLEVEVGPGITAEVELVVSERALELPALVVSAREGTRSSGPGSRSTIDRSAVEHLQASSLSDLLQLLPGQVAGNPSLASAQQSLLRQVPTTAEAARANALGTSLVMDGTPISNNANLQTDVTILNSGAGALPPFSSVAGRGVDLRSVSPDEIESLEVIRGIPSARHGDLTTGLILVQTRVGARRPELRLRANPTLLDLGVAAGWGDGIRESGWSATGTLTGAQDDPRQTLDNFYRGGMQLAWRSRRGLEGRPEATVRFHGWSTLDERRRDPDDTRN